VWCACAAPIYIVWSEKLLKTLSEIMNMESCLHMLLQNYIYKKEYMEMDGTSEYINWLRAGDQTQCQFTIPENGPKDIFIQIGPHLWKFKRYANMPSTQAEHTD